MRPKNGSDRQKLDIIKSGSATYFLKVGACFSLKVTIEACFSCKKNSGNLDFQGTFLKPNEGVLPKALACLPWICHHYTLFSYIFSGSRCTSFIESSHQTVFRGKKLLKLRFLDYFSKAKTETCDQKTCRISDKFEINTTCSTSYHLEVNAPVSLEAVTKASLRGKKTLKTQISDYLSKTKTEECDQKNWS